MTAPKRRTRTGSQCRRCHQHIRWLATTTGSNMPIDPDPDERGNISIQRVAGDMGVCAVVLRSHELIEAQANGDPLYMPHFATCPMRIGGGRR